MYLLHQIPKWLLVSVGLILGFLLMVTLSRPPQSLCHVQLETVKKQLVPLIYLDPEKPQSKYQNLNYLVKQCKEQTSAGTCLAVFDETRNILRNVQTLTADCAAEVQEENTLLSTLTGLRNFLLQLSWGLQPPTVQNWAAFDWISFDQQDDFCKLQNQIKMWSDYDKWVLDLQNSIQRLPGASTLDKNDRWARSIASRCR